MTEKKKKLKGEKDKAKIEMNELDWEKSSKTDL